MLPLQALIIGGFLLVHFSGARLRFLDAVPRSRWLSLAGGISVAYVFVHIFPELAEAQEELAQRPGALPFIEHHAYLVALAGLTVFYGLERMVRASRPQARGAPVEQEHVPHDAVFWIHVASFAVYNALIGYLLVHREEQDVRGLLFFSGAMAVHFLVNDHALQQDHRDTYRRRGRFVLMAALLAGWLAGLATGIGEAALGVLFAFLAGGIILNVLKEELPEERKSRLAPFLLGAVGYSALLLFV